MNTIQQDKLLIYVWNLKRQSEHNISTALALSFSLDIKFVNTSREALSIVTNLMFIGPCLIFIVE